MKNVLFTVAATLVFCTTADAASLTNKDAKSHSLIVTENGVRSELAISVGETLSLCDDGCFLTFPNGERAVLAGSEAVSIVDGAYVIE